MIAEPGQSASKRGFFGLPASWVGWASVVIAVLAIASLFARRLLHRTLAFNRGHDA